MENEIVVMSVHRKVWKPTVNSKTLVVSIPDVPFLKRGDKVTVNVTSKRRLIVEKEVAVVDSGRHDIEDADDAGSLNHRLPDVL